MSVAEHHKLLYSNKFDYISIVNSGHNIYTYPSFTDVISVSGGMANCITITTNLGYQLTASTSQYIRIVSDGYQEKPMSQINIGDWAVLSTRPKWCDQVYNSGEYDSYYLGLLVGHKPNYSGLILEYPPKTNLVPYLINDVTYSSFLSSWGISGIYQIPSVFYSGYKTMVNRYLKGVIESAFVNIHSLAGPSGLLPSGLYDQMEWRFQTNQTGYCNKLQELFLLSSAYTYIDSSGISINNFNREIIEHNSFDYPIYIADFIFDSVTGINSTTAYCYDPVISTGLVYYANGFMISGNDRTFIEVGDPGYQSSDYANNTLPDTSVIVNKPAGLAVGNLMIACHGAGYSGGGDVFTTPAGWSLLDKTVLTDTMAVVYYKVADSADVAASTFTFETNTTVDTQTVFVINLTDAASISTYGSNSSEAAINILAPSLTAAIDNLTILLGYTSVEADINSFAGDTNITNSDFMCAGYKKHTVAGATGTFNLNLNNSDPVIVYHVLVQ